MKSIAISFICCMVLWPYVNSYGVIYKICTEKYDRDACQQIARDQQYACAEDIGSAVDCILNIDQGLPQFSIIKPEEALLAAPLVSSTVVVVGEVASEHPAYETAIIVRKPFDGGFENLRGKRFCHPGFRHNELVTKFVLGEFESKIISLNSSYCDIGENATVFEKRIRALSNFFGTACRPGTWTESEALDIQLKTKYSNLCELCGTEGCNINYQVPFNESLSCLTDRAGDIALTTLNDAALFFNSSTNAENFLYLCTDGTVSDSTTPCLWTKQLNRLIITDSTSADAVKSFIGDKLSTHLAAFSTMGASSDVYLASLQKVLDLAQTDKIQLSTVTPLSVYVQAGRSIPTVNETVQCGLVVRWCTLTNEEQQKCKWLQQAALNAGIQPVIECIQTADKDTLSCLNDIKEDRADITFTDVNYGYIALKKGLTVVAYPETDTRQLSSILVVIRADATDPPKSLSDLKGKRSCFPEYGGKEWLSFIHTLRDKKILENSCDYGKIFSVFVDSSCVPSANSNDYEIENADQSKLCAQCIPIVNTLTHAYCNADKGNKYYRSNGALKCLEDQAAEYAVITKNDVTGYETTSSQFRVLAKNGTLAEYTGFDVDEGAALTILTAGGVVAKADSLKKDDIVVFLRAIELEFGQRLDKFFKVFERFNNTNDLLFPDSTPGLTFGGTSIKYVDNFRTMLEYSEKCMSDGIPPSSASSAMFSTVLIFIVAFITVRL
uniref:Transferrin n=1 Tax=Anoplophora glabripennis TaxID=217634 RepID=V5I8N4_ANOGL